MPFESWEAGPDDKLIIKPSRDYPHAWFFHRYPDESGFGHTTGCQTSYIRSKIYPAVTDPLRRSFLWLFLRWFAFGSVPDEAGCGSAIEPMCETAHDTPITELQPGEVAVRLVPQHRKDPAYIYLKRYSDTAVHLVAGTPADYFATLATGRQSSSGFGDWWLRRCLTPDGTYRRVVGVYKLIPREPTNGASASATSPSGA